PELRALAIREDRMTGGPGGRARMLMPAWALRTLAIAISGLTMLGSSSYVLAHPFNSEAPLHPPVAKDESGDSAPRPAEPTPTPTPTPSPTRTPSPSPTRTVAPTKTAAPVAKATATIAPTVRPPTLASRTPVPTPRPTLVLTSGVKVTAVPKV